MINRYYKYSEYSNNNTIEINGETIDITNRDDSIWENTDEFKYMV